MYNKRLKQKNFLLLRGDDKFFIKYIEKEN